MTGTEFSTLGNDSDQDSDREAPPPTIVKDKPTARSGKRDGSGNAPSESRGAAAGGERGGRGGRRGGNSGSEGGRTLSTFMGPII